MKRLIPVLMALLLPALAQAGDPSDRALVIMRAQQKDYFVQEGLGLMAVHIGLKFDQVLRIWGKPVSRRTGLPLVGTDSWYYRADRMTEIRLRGKTTVQAMAFRGEVGSPYQTSAGAQFGMKTTDLRNVYGTPGKLSSDGKVLDFPGRGIRFQLVNGQVDGFEIYTPRN